TLPGRSAEVLAVAYSPDGRFIAAGSADGTTRLWNATTQELVHAFRAHRGGVFATRFSADGNRLVTLGGDRAVRVWDVRTRRLVQSLPNAHKRTRAHVVWGEGVAFVGDDRVAVAQSSREGGTQSAVVARVFDLSSGKEVSVVKDPAGPTQTIDIDVSPDGKLLVAGHAQGPLQLYRLSDGRQLDVEPNGAQAGAILDVEFSHDGKFVATGAVDGFAKIWSVANGRLREVVTLRGHDNPVGSVSFDRDGTRLASWGQVSDEARVWDVTPAGPGEV